MEPNRAPARVTYYEASRCAVENNRRGDMSTDAKKDTADNRVQSIGPGKTVLMPDIYNEEFSVENEPLEIAEESPSINDETGGFNPYDTAVLYKK